MIPNIAIQGHLTRGEEVIQILESLGGINDSKFRGVTEFWYFIDSKGHISNNYQNILINYGFKIYTLEEFEKEFPFKIGEKVTTTGTSHPKIITGITDTQWGLRYVISEIKFPDSKEMPHISQISLYKEMKEERNITLTLDKAKEWYKKGGELKEVALQAYSEEELTKAELPRTWKEFCINCPIQAGEAFISNQTSQIRKYNNTYGRRLVNDKNVCPSEKSAEAHLALIQLEQLRDCYRQGDIPDFNNDDKKYCIIKIKNDIHVGTCYNTSNFLSFTKKEVAEEFLNNFKPLIKIAEDYI